jgi:diguanylate cyclase (GGDEF)-like protein
MQLRTRIAVTFLLLLAAVLAVALTVVSHTNRQNAAHALTEQLKSGDKEFHAVLDLNVERLELAARIMAADAGFRAAIADQDTETVISALENTGIRIKAPMVVLTAMDGTVIAASGSRAAIGGRTFADHRLFERHFDSDRNILPNDTVVVEHGRIYQLVAVVINNPLPVAWVVMGFEIDQTMAKQLKDITGLGVTFAIKSGGGWNDVVSTEPATQRPHSAEETRRIDLPDRGPAAVIVTLSKSFAAAMQPFDRLTQYLYWIAGIALAVSAAAAFLLARNITRPLLNITAAVDQIRAGVYDAPVVVHRRDEVGLLAEGIQVMQSAVQSRDQSIRRLAYEDTLTGLMNRAAFNTRLEEALSAGGDGVAVAVINLSRFRRINEHLGYAVGDAVLKTIAARLIDGPHPAGQAARLAADQFAAFMPLRSTDSLQTWGASLLVRLSDPIVVASQPIDITATLGLARSPADANSADELLRCADLALDRARRDKRGLASYEPAMKPAELNQLSLLGELRQAVDNDELRLFFQPKIELASGRVAGAEVLLRWQHPTRGLLGPGAFIPFAEQTGFIRQITRWTLEKSLDCSVEWLAAGQALPLSVNVTVDDINDENFPLRVANALARHRFPPSLLTLEVTESGFIDDPARAIAMLDALANLGLQLSIDDFGTGYSSLSHLARMPVHEVKIDRSFVLGLESDVEFAAVVRSAIEMGHSLGLQVVAEGIETETAARRLTEMNCDVAQGYLYAKPMPRAELERWLEHRPRVPVPGVAQAPLEVETASAAKLIVL